MKIIDYCGKNVCSNGKIYNRQGKKQVGVSNRNLAGTPTRTFYDGNWFERVRMLNENGKISQRLVKDVVWNAFNGAIPKGYVVFPIDRRKNNSELDNLCLIRKKDEYKFYFLGSNTYKKRMKSMYNIEVEREFGTQYEQGFSMKKKNHEEQNYLGGY